MFRCRHIALSGVLIAAWAAVGAAQERPEAALGRVSAVGAITDAERLILANRVEGFLAQHYRLIPSQEYQSAEDEAFANLDVDQCTEDNCVRLIQEFLQVERLFLLQIVREETLTQIKVTLYRGEARRVAEDVCSACSINQLYDRTNELAARLVAEDQAPAAMDATAPGAEEPAGPPQWPLWGGAAALAVGAVMIVQGLNDAAAAESKASDARSEVDEAKYNSAKDDADAADQLVTVGVVAVAAGAAMLAYYYFFADPPADTAQRHPGGSATPADLWTVRLADRQAILGIRLRW